MNSKIIVIRRNLMIAVRGLFVTNFFFNDVRSAIFIPKTSKARYEKYVIASYGTYPLKLVQLRECQTLGEEKG